MKDEKLLEVLVPDPKYFFILYGDDGQIPIEKYRNININFSQRVVFEEGVRRLILSPMITYYVEIASQHRSQFQFIFEGSDVDANLVLHTMNINLQLGVLKYKFKADITATPSGIVNHPFLSHTEINNCVKIDLKLENTNISLFASAEEAYEEYTSRFELLDL